MTVDVITLVPSEPAGICVRMPAGFLRSCGRMLFPENKISGRCPNECKAVILNDKQMNIDYTF